MNEYKEAMNFKYGKFANKFPRDNQFIREINNSYKKVKKVYDYLEKENVIMRMEAISGNLLCMRKKDEVIFETSIEVVYDFIKEQKYTKKEIEYSNKIKLEYYKCLRNQVKYEILTSNLSYLDDINPILRKIKCKLNRMKLKIKELMRFERTKKVRKISKKSFQLFDILNSIRLYG